MQDVGLSELCAELEIAGIAPGDQQRLAAAVAAGAPLMTSKPGGWPPCIRPSIHCRAMKVLAPLTGTPA